MLVKVVLKAAVKAVKEKAKGDNIKNRAVALIKNNESIQ